jgi:hypothetical protein
VRAVAAAVILVLVTGTACSPSSKGPNANGRKTDLRSKSESHSCSTASADQRRKQVLYEYFLLRHVGDAVPDSVPTFPPDCRSPQSSAAQHRLTGEILDSASWRIARTSQRGARGARDGIPPRRGVSRIPRSRACRCKSRRSDVARAYGAAARRRTDRRGAGDRRTRTDARDGLNSNASGRFFGWVIGGSLPTALAADWLASEWGQNAAIYATSPASAVIEEAAGAWLKDIFGLPRDASFALVTGCQMAHATCLTAARHALLTRSNWNVEARGLPALRRSASFPPGPARFHRSLRAVVGIRKRRLGPVLPIVVLRLRLGIRFGFR